MILALTAAWAGSLRIEDLTPCSGSEIPAGTAVTVHYSGRLEDGSVFDSSKERGEPLTVTLGKGMLIEGWEIGMQGMSVGCRRRVTIPPELGYRDGQTRVFEIELLEMRAGRPPAPAKPRPVPNGAYQSTASGVEYFDFREGTGETARSGKNATVEYTLWLANGTRVDSSLLRQAPFRYGVGRGVVIPGWEEAVMGMKEGGVRQFRVPWKLAYGRRGRPPVIPPKAELVFEVELLALD